MREAILDLTGFRDITGESNKKREKVSFKQLTFRLSKVIEKSSELFSRQFERNNIELIQGSARFKDQHTIEVVNKNGKITHEIEAGHFLISTGSRPRESTRDTF